MLEGAAPSLYSGFRPVLLSDYMKIGLVSATLFEIQPALRFIEELPAGFPHQLEPVITGVGTMAVTYQVASALGRSKWDYLLQAGIGGSFSDRLSLADVVLVQEEIMGDTGVEEESFRDLFDMGFAEADKFPYTGKGLVNPFVSGWESLSLPLVRGLTVNEITTRPARLQQLREKYAPGVESMEGAGFHYACLMQGVPFLQLRSISNQVGERNKSKWNIGGAIGTLNKALMRIIQQLTAS